MQHGIADTGALGHAQGGTARGHDAALHFHLRKAAVVGRDHDVGAQHQLDADGEADALDGGHHGLGAAAVAGQPVVMGLDQARRNDFLARAQEFGHHGQVQPGREMAAEGVQQAYAQPGSSSSRV